jgi:hypothetical protein
MGVSMFYERVSKEGGFSDRESSEVSRHKAEQQGVSEVGKGGGPVSAGEQKASENSETAASGYGRFSRRGRTSSIRVERSYWSARLSVRRKCRRSEIHC